MRVHKALSFCVTVRKAAVALTLGSLVVLPSRDDVDLVAGNADILEQVIVQLRKRPEGPAIALVGANFRKYMGEIHGASSCCAFCAVPKSIQIGLVFFNKYTDLYRFSMAFGKISAAVSDLRSFGDSPVLVTICFF